MSAVTDLIDEMNRGNQDARESLFVLIYDELRNIARSQMAREKSGHTLQPTALVNEVFLKLFKGTDLEFRNKKHFLFTASRAMQRILVDSARAKKRQKRGGEAVQQPLSDSVAVSLDEFKEMDVIDLNDALEEFSKLDESRAELVQLHIFAGLTLEECASVQGTSKSTAERRWRFARAWLLNKMSGTEGT